MFGKGKLLREGAKTRGVVIESVGHDLAQGGIARSYKVKVRVRFDDGSTAEVSGKLDRLEDGWHTEGDVLPVRYDSADRSKVEIDEPALKAQHAAKLAELGDVKEAAIAQAESQLSVGASSGAGRSLGPAANVAGGDAELAELLEFEKAESGSGSARLGEPLSGSRDSLDRLQQVADLHDRGVLSDDEFASEKAKILNET